MMTTLYYVVCFVGAGTLAKWCMEFFDYLDDPNRANRK